MKLSQTRADKIKEPGRYGDGRGLYLQITAAGNRSWIFRYERGGHERMMGLGPCADFTLDEVREFARSARRKLKDGTDPIDDRRAVAARTAEAVAAADAKAITRHSQNRGISFHRHAHFIKRASTKADLVLNSPDD
jgi:hypothetical protein